MTSTVARWELRLREDDIVSMVKLVTGYDRPAKSESGWRLMGRVARFVRPYGRRLAAYAGLLVVASAAGVAPPLLFRELLDDAIPTRQAGQVMLLVVGAVASYALSSGLLLLGGYIGTRIGTGIIRDLRQVLFDHLQRMPLAFFVRASTGAVQSRLNTDVVNAQQMFTGQLFTGSVASVVADVLTLGFMLLAMFVLSWQAAAVFLVVVAPVLLLSYFGRRLRPLVREQMELYARMNAFTQERFNVGGALLVKLFGSYHSESKQFRGHINALRRNNLRVNMLAMLVGTGIAFVGFAAVVALYGAGSLLTIGGALTVGTVVALVAYGQRAYPPLMDLGSARMNIQAALVSFERVFEVLDTTTGIEEKPDPVVRELDGLIEIDSVSFQYGQEDAGFPPSLVMSAETQKSQPALQDVSFTVRPGTMTALVGHSGAGKTTLCQLIARLHDVSGGAIRLDGIDVRDYALSTLSAQIGVVSQDAHFFHESIRANLLFAKPDASGEELVKACEAACIAELIDGLPDGYDTIVGERGYRFSGGEKQRLALARVLLRNPQILVLDEATAHLDTRTERSVQQALQAAMAGRTAVVIAHRLSTVREADQIVVLSKGRVASAGTHQELLAKSDIYNDLYRQQFAEAS